MHDHRSSPLLGPIHAQPRLGVAGLVVVVGCVIVSDAVRGGSGAGCCFGSAVHMLCAGKTEAVTARSGESYGGAGAWRRVEARRGLAVATGC